MPQIWIQNFLIKYKPGGICKTQNITLYLEADRPPPIFSGIFNDWILFKIWPKPPPQLFSSRCVCFLHPWNFQFFLFFRLQITFKLGNQQQNYGWYRNGGITVEIRKFEFVLIDTGENVQKWTRVFSTRRWILLVARTRRKKEKKIMCPLLDVFACQQVSSPRLYRLRLI